ncbi:uncharacterized protein LOC117105799 [Anneissia japonica]|uniref:uncharacterized protein LOC117105799 n=1 Tax=Anneissia japonica TaxID=1529436 RepID=UPI0014259A2E|nr:uncharacterized protein LOC117105799 [Anneissia japonica]
MDRNARRKERLDKYCANFVQTVEVENILHYFPKMTKGTKELIRRKATNEGNRAGAYELYMKITKADSDWYDYLMNALRKAGYSDLLKLLQDDDDGGNGDAACKQP